MFSVSALNRLAANSKDDRVRVEGSMNRLTMVRPRSVGTFLMGRVADCLAKRQAKVGQGDHRLDRVAAGGEGEILHQWRVVTDTGIIGIDPVGLAISPTHLDDQIHTKRLGQAGRVALVGIGKEAGGRVVVGVEIPVVVVAVLHPLGRVVHRRGGDTVNTHRQVQVVALDVG